MNRPFQNIGIILTCIDVILLRRLWNQVHHQATIVRG
jgi:hypothetical protein